METKEKVKVLIDKYIEIIAKIIELGIYFGDFNYYNFIVNDGELFVIDLEDYRKDIFLFLERIK
ncbi:RIO1 family regulatory kinase/ATPase [Fusobacterium varium]